MEFFLAEKGKPHVKSLHFRALVAAMSGTGTYIAPLYEQLKPELAANNVVKIRSGFLMHHGGIFFVQPNTYDEVTYMNGTQGMKRIDLVVGRYTKNEETGIEEGVWKVIQGTPAASNPAVPAHIAGDMQNGDLVDECPLFELHFDGINVTEVKKLVPVTKNIEELTLENEDRKNEIAQLNGKSQWNLLCNGLAQCTLPNEWSEINIVAFISNYSVVSFFVLKSNIIHENTYFRTGSYNNNDDNYGCTILFDLINNTISLEDFSAGSVSYKDKAKMRICYKK